MKAMPSDAEVARNQALQRTNPAQACIENIERIVRQRGGEISSAQVHMVAHCLRRPGTSTTLNVQAAP